jgi:hypothetical protein
MQMSENHTTEQSPDENPPVWSLECTSREILWLGQEAVVFFRVGKQGLVLVQRNAWSAGPHELEWVNATSLRPLDSPAGSGERV